MQSIRKGIKRDLKGINGIELNRIVNQAKGEVSPVKHLLQRGLNFRQLELRGVYFDSLARFLTPKQLYELGAPLYKLQHYRLHGTKIRPRYLRWQELLGMGVPPVRLTESMIANSGLTRKELIQRGVPAVEIAKALKWQRERNEREAAGEEKEKKSMGELLEQYSLSQLKRMRVPVRDLIGEVPLRRLVSKGFSQVEMLKAGVSWLDLLRAGGDLRKIILEVRRSIDIYGDVQAVMNAGFAPTDFFSRRIWIKTLLRSNFTLRNLHDMGFSARAILKSRAKLLKSRVKVEDLIRSNFSIRSIHEAGVPLSTLASLVPRQSFLAEGFSQREIDQALRELRGLKQQASRK
ncbi:MAG: hypothetical protein WC634_05865 [archaeon]